MSEPREVTPGVPASPDAVPTEVVAPAAAPEAVAPPRKRRRGWIVALIVVGVLVVLGVVGFFVAEAVAKDYARDYVRARVVEVLQLPDDAHVDIDLGEGSIILQALAGRVDSVGVDAPEVTFGDLTGAVRLDAQGVPLDAAAPVDVLRVEFAMGADDLASLNAGEADPDAAAFEFVDGEATLETEVELFGVAIPLGFALAPSAADGDLVLSPTRLTIGDATFLPGEADDSFLGQLAQAFLQPQTLCIADRVPAALVLADAVIAGDELRLGFRGDGVALGDESLQSPGVCPAAD